MVTINHNKLCSSCEHFSRLPDDCGLAFCSNPLTKELNPPIGFLDTHAEACELFEEFHMGMENNFMLGAQGLKQAGPLDREAGAVAAAPERSRS